MASAKPGAPHENHLLAALPRAEYAQLLPHLHQYRFDLQHRISYIDEPVTQVYFPHTGMVSELLAMSDGAMIEVGVTGIEGMVGVQALFGGGTATELLVQLASDGVWIGIEALRAASPWGSQLYGLMGRYLQALWRTAAQAAACNRLHPIELRCARWLLMTQDRANADEFVMTHEFLSHMLGTRRATVTLAAGILQQAGLIHYSRGRVRVRDRAGLEDASCECYAIMRTALAGVVAN